MYQAVLNFDNDENDPRYIIRPEVSEDAPKDNTVVLINPAIAEEQGMPLDNQGFPTLQFLEAWHRKHNPHLITE
jgi:hypothetical protein